VYEEMAVAVEPLLTRYGVQAYFCGHDHNLQVRASRVQVPLSWLLLTCVQSTAPLAPRRARFPSFRGACGNLNHMPTFRAPPPPPCCTHDYKHSLSPPRSAQLLHKPGTGYHHVTSGAGSLVRPEFFGRKHSLFQHGGNGELQQLWGTGRGWPW
jgi:hypothetical protein